MRAALLLLTGCLPSGERPLLLAEDGGAGIWPGNSLYAVERALDAGVDGVELDVGLTADGVVVLATGGELGPTCAGPGGPLGATDAAALAAWTCGGTPNPAWPGAEVSAQPVSTLADLTALLVVNAPIVVELTLAGGDPELLAAAVFDTWLLDDPPNELWLASPEPVRLEAAEVAARARGVEAATRLVVPGTSRGADLLGFGALDAGEADGIALPWDRARLHEVSALSRDGVRVELLDADEPGVVATHRDWPLAALRSGYPGDQP